MTTVGQLAGSFTVVIVLCDAAFCKTAGSIPDDFPKKINATVAVVKRTELCWIGNLMLFSASTSDRFTKVTSPSFLPTCRRRSKRAFYRSPDAANILS